MGALFFTAILIVAACNRGSAPGGEAETTQAKSPEVRATAPVAAGPPWFEEVSAERGLDFEHASGFASRHLMPEIMGGGAALFDLEGDGDLDLYLVQGGSVTAPADAPPGNRLYENDGSGVFRDRTAGSGAEDQGYGMGVTCGDYDNDGDVDLYVTNVGPNVLLRNDGDGTFTDVTAEARVGDAGWGASAAFIDYDRDGDLDLFVTNYLNWSIGNEIDCYNDMGGPDYCSPQNYSAPARDVLYRNVGTAAAPRFEDATVQSGVASAVGTGLGVATGDFDGDGWVDIFVANDGMADRLWINEGDGTFRDDAMLAGCAVDEHGDEKAGMGVTVGDVDDDGDLDLLVCNLNRETDSYYRNDGGFFSDVTAARGLAVVSRPFTRFGMGWIDFDNDGHLDLYQANGRVMRQSRTYGDDAFAEPNLLFRGQEGGVFHPVEPPGGTAPLLVGTSRAAAFGDVDGDGGVDIVVVNRDGPVHLLRNVVPDRGNWLALRVIGRNGSDAHDAVVELRIGERTVRRAVRPAYSYLASNDPSVHVGLGEGEGVDQVIVHWPDGGRTEHGPKPVGQVHVLRRSEERKR